MISESLEPCPFCGAAAVYHNQGSGWGVVTCSAGKHTCAANPHIYDREAEARNAWNTRTPQGVASAAANPNPARPPAQGVDVGKLREGPYRIAEVVAYADRHGFGDDMPIGTTNIRYGDLRQALTPSSERLTSAIAQLDAGEGVEREVAAQASSEGDERSCTCHPDDAVEPCARKYAASECAARAQASLLPPVGWVMVPVEPTEAMIDAAEAALGEWRKTLSPDEAILRRSAPVQNGRQWMASATPREKAAIRYAAMIAAAPVSGASHG
jgi:hypothetical protein